MSKTKEFSKDDAILQFHSKFVLLNYSSLCFAFHCAVRTKNWDLRMYVLKKSIKVFKRSSKERYVKLITDHLNDMKAFSNRDLCLQKHLWAFPGKTTGTYISPDEEIEFINGRMKKVVSVPTIQEIQYASQCDNFVQNIDKNFEIFFSQDGAAEKERKREKKSEALALDMKNLQEMKNHIIEPSMLFSIPKL